jgi:hypothetical protein
MIQVHIAVCAVVRILILEALRILMSRLISSPNSGKRKGLRASFLFVGVVNLHHWDSVYPIRRHTPSSRMLPSVIGGPIFPIDLMCARRSSALFVRCIYIEWIVMFGGSQCFKHSMPRIQRRSSRGPQPHPNPFGTYLALTVERSGLLFGRGAQPLPAHFASVVTASRSLPDHQMLYEGLM